MQAERSAGALAENHRFDRFQNDHQVEKYGHILDVKKIVIELFLGVFHRSAVRVADLRPAGILGLTEKRSR